MTHTTTSESAELSAVLRRLLAAGDLDAGQCRTYLRGLFTSECPAELKAALIVALTAKGVTASELHALVEEMLHHAVPLACQGDIDIVGTGGDGHHTVNISTMTSLVVAASGARVIKHGNRAASSKCGTADVLEQLGIRLDLAPEAVAAVAREAGITFAFAQTFHPALKQLASIRKVLGIPTPLNWFGPLCNPAQPPAYLLGVADPQVGPLAAGVLSRRGHTGLVVHGHGAVDELTLSGPCEVWLPSTGDQVSWTLDAADFGLPRVGLDQLRGGDAAYNAEVVTRFVEGQPGPVADTVMFNAAVAVAILERGTELSEESLREALPASLDRCRQLVADGVVASAVARWQAASHAA